MTSKCQTWSTTLIALLSVLFINRVALAAQNEVECNNPAVDAGGNVALDVNGNPVAKPLVFDASGMAEVNGAIVNGVGFNPCAVPGGRYGGPCPWRDEFVQRLRRHTGYRE